MLHKHFFVGGYWGIFLGYALVAMPQMIGSWMKKSRKVFARGKTNGVIDEKQRNVYTI